jgi:hypothetical protein
MNLVVLHKLADLQAAGDAGSRAARSAEGHVADPAARIVHHQTESGAAHPFAAGTRAAARLVSMLSRGRRCGGWARARCCRPSPLMDRNG